MKYCFSFSFISDGNLSFVLKLNIPASTSCACVMSIKHFVPRFVMSSKWHYHSLSFWAPVRYTVNVPA